MQLNLRTILTKISKCVYRLELSSGKSALDVLKQYLELEYSPDPDNVISWVREAYREASKLIQKLIPGGDNGY